MRKIVSIGDLKIGDRVEEPIKDDNGVDLIARGTVLTDGVLRLLRRRFEGKDVLVTVEDGTIEYNPHDLEEVKDRSLQYLKNIFSESDEEKETEEINKLREIISAMAKDLENITTLPSDVLRTDNNYLGEHYFRVARLAMSLASIYNKKTNDESKISLEAIGMAAILHDYGKKFSASSADDKIKLMIKECASLEELDNIDSKKNHHTLAYIALRGKVESDVRKTILFGSYDDKSLKNSAKKPCVQATRIIKICDIYDSLLDMISKKRITSPADCVIDYMSEVSENGEISQDIYRLFASRLPLYTRGAKVLLSNDQHAVVVDNNANPVKPTVLTLTGGAPTLIDLSETNNLKIKKVEARENIERKNSEFLHDHLQTVYESLEDDNALAEMLEVKEESNEQVMEEEQTVFKKVSSFFGRK